MKIYRPKEFAALIGKSVKTLQRWDYDGILIAKRSGTNRRFYTHEQYLEYLGVKADESKKVVVYCRVSNSRQRCDLARQKAVLEQFVAAKGYVVSEWLSEVGSGLDCRRPLFLQLMDSVEDGEVRCIVMAHRDRLVRFGYEWFERFCAKHGTELVAMNNESLSPGQEIIADLCTVLGDFSARVQGLKSLQKSLRAQCIAAGEEKAEASETAF